jgi:hypothetical protein
MKPARIPLAAFFAVLIATSVAAADYFPPRGSWDRKTPAELGIDAATLKEAIDYAVANENPSSKDVAEDLRNTFGKREPDFKIVGPTQPRAALNGIVIRRGYVVAELGRHATRRHGAQRHQVVPDDRRRPRVAARPHPQSSTTVHPGTCRPPSGAQLFGTEHNAPITWDHLLRQTSDWSGTLWGIPDWADRPEGATPADWPNRPMRAPGTYFKYNDVRVNLLALCALHVWRRPLPQVLREEVMDPIGASNTWRWYGYETSWIELDGERLQSVSGGGHFGGGFVHQRVGHGALRLSFPAWRQVGRPRDRVGKMDRARSNPR